MNIIGYVVAALIAVVLLCALAVVGRSLPDLRRYRDPADVAAVARYSIVPDRSQVWIEARSNVHPIHSSTSGLEGYVELDLGPSGTVDPAGTPAGSLSLAVDRLKSGNRMEDRELQKRIDARKFPRIEGRLEQVAPNGSEASYRVTGEVTFRGVSRRYEDRMTSPRWRTGPSV